MILVPRVISRSVAGGAFFRRRLMTRREKIASAICARVFVAILWWLSRRQVGISVKYDSYLFSFFGRTQRQISGPGEIDWDKILLW